MLLLLPAVDDVFRSIQPLQWQLWLQQLAGACAKRILIRSGTVVLDSTALSSRPTYFPLPASHFLLKKGDPSVPLRFTQNDKKGCPSYKATEICNIFVTFIQFTRYMRKFYGNIHKILQELYIDLQNSIDKNYAKVYTYTVRF